MLSSVRNSLVSADSVVCSRRRLGITLHLPQPILKRSSTRSFTFSANRATGSKLQNDSAPLKAGISERTRNVALALKNVEESVVLRKPDKKYVKITNKVRVANVPFFATAEAIQDLFTPCGHVLSVELEKDQDGRFYGRAIVTFADKQYAKAAVQLNQILFRDRPLHITHVIEPRPSPKLFITNIAYTATKQDLWNLFSDPRPRKVAFPPPLDGRPRGFAHVEFHTHQEAGEAREKYNRTLLEERPIEIYFADQDNLLKRADDKKMRPAPRAPWTQTLFVGNFDFEGTESDLMDIFGKFEPVTVHIATDASGSPAGSAFVRFRSGEDAQRALEGTAGTELLGRPLRIEHAKRHQLAPPSDTLFIGNIASGTPLSKLEDAFAEFNVVAAHRLPRTETQVHMRFRSVQDAQRAREAWNGKVIRGKRLKILFAPKPKDKGDGYSKNGSVELP